MIRGDRQQERRLRKLVAAAGRRLPKERRGKAYVSRNYAWRNVRWIVAPAAFFLPASQIAVEHLFALLALHGVLSLLRRVGELWTALRDPGELWVPFTLPLRDDAIFDAQTRAWRRAVVLLGVDWLALATGLAVFRDATTWAWLALPLAASQAALVAALALRVTRGEPRSLWAIISGGLHFAAFFGALFVGKSPGVMRWLLEDGTALVLHGTPMGWLAMLAGTAESGAGATGAVSVALAGTALVLAQDARRSWRARRESYSVDEWTAPLLSGEATPPGPAAEAAEAEPPQPGAVAAGVSERETRLALRHAWERDPAEAYAAQGPLERLVARGFTARQRSQLALYGPPPSMTHRVLGKAAAIVLATGLVAGVVGSRKLGVGGAILGFVWLLPFWGGRWAALWSVQQGVARAPAHAFLPVSLWSLAGAYLGAGLARVFLAAIVLAAGLSPWLGMQAAWHHGALGGAMAAALLPLALLQAISECSNDSSARWWLTAMALPLVLTYLVGGVSLAVTMFMVENPAVSAVCAGLLLLISHGLLVVYLWCAGRPWFDFVKHERG